MEDKGQILLYQTPDGELRKDTQGRVHISCRCCREKPRQKQGVYTAESGSLCRCSSIGASAPNIKSARSR
jgi:hypothetical protein